MPELDEHVPVQIVGVERDPQILILTQIPEMLVMTIHHHN
jgi:hypothetical protein